MARRRDLARPAGTWLVVRDMWHVIVSHQHAHADPRAALRAKVAAMQAEGWTIESPDLTYDSTFANRGAERLLVSLLPEDPARPRPPGHSTDHYMGSHSAK